MNNPIFLKSLYKYTISVKLKEKIYNSEANIKVF